VYLCVNQKAGQNRNLTDDKSFENVENFKYWEQQLQIKIAFTKELRGD
jgi:hypothetical protein